MSNSQALILIDWQVGFDQYEFWGGNRNNPAAETNARSLLDHWRANQFPIIHCIHDSQSADSLLRLDKESGKIKPGFEPRSNEPLIVKNVNSCFIGTDLQERLKSAQIQNLIICGLTTNHCVSTTTRMAGNFGFDVTLVGDACATFDRKDTQGDIIPAEIVHSVSLANIHNEFCVVENTAEILKR